MIIVLCLGAFLGSCFLTYLIRHYAVSKSLVDIPNARSSHSQPTPRGGGLSVVLVFLALLWVIFDINRSSISLFIACSLVAGIGFWDDHHHIPARWRLLVHFLAALIALLGTFAWQNIAFFGFTMDSTVINLAVYTLVLVWLLNLYNFMDGIDGIASVEAVTVSLNAAVLMFINSGNQQSPLFLALLILAAAVTGFLVWNWPHAKIFMGDACSGFLGFTLGVLAIMASAAGMVNIWSWLILLAVFISDASLTLVKRILNGEVWYEAHSSHAYQHYARQLIKHFQLQGFEHQDARTKSHRRISYFLSLVNIGWLLPLAIAASFYPFWAVLITVIAYLPLLWIAHCLKAGIKQ